ncbi:VTT domain-containing protein [Brachybacterium sp. AOP35-5H-19]|uniref:VTT domain-containing protein n=1 Tax=Brachybacterium sp. AOP35-5H-19 TaxID=3457685 RepID=UPI003FB801B0
MGEFIDWLLSLTGQVEDWILVIADAWWVHLVVYGFAALDGFFPSVPSESTIVSLSSLWSSSGQPSIILVGLAAWMGAWTGDNLGYWLGRLIGWERFRFLREGKGRKAVDAAEKGLRRRALVFLMTARYIPFGRTAVNLVAGAVHYPHQRFWPRSLLSTFVWAVYSCLIGAVAGAWFGEHHLLAITVALVAAVALALIVERLINAVHRVLDRRADAREAQDAGDAGEPRTSTENSAELTGTSGEDDSAASADPVDPDQDGDTDSADHAAPESGPEVSAQSDPSRRRREAGHMIPQEQDTTA